MCHIEGQHYIVVEMLTHYDEIYKDEKKYERLSQINIDLYVAS